MAYSYNEYTGDGSTDDFSVTFDYLQEADVKIYIDGVEDTAAEFTSSGIIHTSFVPASGANIYIERRSDLSQRAVDFTTGSLLTEEDLDTSAEQVFKAAQEAIDAAERALSLDYDGLYDAESRRIKNLADPVNDQDAATKNYLENEWLTPSDKEKLNTLNLTKLHGVYDNLSDVNAVADNEADIDTVAANITSVNTVATNIDDVITVANDLNEAISEIETAADDLNEAVSEIDTVATNIANVNTVGNNITNVNTVAGNNANVTTVAGISANVTTVAGIDSDVSTVAGNSSNITTVAGISSDVTTVADNVTDITNFADVYQGGKATDPTTRNDGSALQVGDLYFNTTVNELRTYSGSQWVSGTAGTMAVQRFTGDGSNTTFTLSTAPSGENNTQVYVNGIYQQKDTYSVSGTSLVLTEAPLTDEVVEVVTISTLALGETDASLVTYSNGKTGAVERTVLSKLTDLVSVKDFGATGNGTTDDTAALIKAAASMTDGSTMYFPNGTYLISHSGFSDFTAAFGNAVFDLNDLDNIKLVGDGATIKVVDHNISTYGGLSMFMFTNCNGVTVSGFNFEMTFTGYKSDSAYYPQCGAIKFTNDSSADGQNPNDLSGDILVEHCEFKLFHPLGCWGRNADPANYYGGDYNNAFKIFSVFVSSPYQADQYENTGRNCTIRDCRIKEGHNAYGFWVWATYNAVFDNLVAESWVTKYTEVDTGTILGGGVPFIRHHQFRTEGAKVTNCYFRAKPSSERTVSGFEGSGVFIHFSTNINEDLAKGEYIVANNIVTHGGGDPVYTVDNIQMQCVGYGNYIFDGNIFDGHDGETNGGTSILLSVSNGSSAGGVGSVVISNNTWGKWSNSNNIQISTGNNTGAYNRRYQQVSITGNTSLSQAQYFLFLGNNSTFTYDGVQSLNVSNNIIDGTYSAADKTNTNSRAISLKGTESTDTYIVSNNIIRSKYYGILNYTTNANLQTFGNKFIDVTDEFTDSTVSETISGHSQQGYYGTFEGSGECAIIAKEVSSGNSIRLYQQSIASYVMASNDMLMYSGGSEVARFNSSGLRFPNGNGVDFSQTSNATGMTSELLDDYEEGVWTPTYEPQTGSFTTITVVSTGRYTKVGRLVTVFGNIYTNGTLDTTGGSGNLWITGLPYVCNSTINGGGTDTSHQSFNLGTDILSAGLVVGKGTSRISLYKNTLNGSSFPNGNITVTEMKTSGVNFSNLINFVAQYEV